MLFEVFSSNIANGLILSLIGSYVLWLLSPFISMINKKIGKYFETYMMIIALLLSIFSMGSIVIFKLWNLYF